MISYLSSFIWAEEPEIKADTRQVQLRHLLHKQIIMSNLILKSVEAKPSISDSLIDSELTKLVEYTKKIPIKKNKKNKSKR